MKDSSDHFKDDDQLVKTTDSDLAIPIAGLYNREILRKQHSKPLKYDPNSYIYREGRRHQPIKQVAVVFYGFTTQ